MRSAGEAGIGPIVIRGAMKASEQYCDTCGEIIGPAAAAEVVRNGLHVVVHADTCLDEYEEVA